MGLDNPVHIAFLLLIVLLVFGAKRLPELGRSLGTGMRSFKESISGEGPSTAQLEDPAAAAIAAPAASAPVAEPSPQHSAARPLA